MCTNDGDAPAIPADAQFVAKKSVIVTEVDDELVMLDEDSETYYGVNPVGAFIWNRLDQPTTVGELESATTEEFDVSVSECRDDVRTFLEELRTADLVDQV